MDVAADSPAAVGYASVQARRCGRCHQPANPAAGILSGQTTPTPGTGAYGSNLTPDPDTGMDGWDAGAIAASILRGATLDGGALCAAMPTFADAGMSPGEALAIAAYLQTLTPVWHLVPRSTCGAAPTGGDGG